MINFILHLIKKIFEFIFAKFLDSNDIKRKRIYATSDFNNNWSKE